MLRASLTHRTLPMRSNRAKSHEIDKENDSIQPVVKKAKKNIDLNTQREAFGIILKMRAANGGILKYGAVEAVVRDFRKAGYGDQVTSHMIFYRLGRLKKGLPAFKEDAGPLGEILVDNEAADTTRESSLTGPADIHTSPSDYTSAYGKEQSYDVETSIVSTNKDGRPTDDAKRERLQVLRDATTLVASRYNETQKRYEMMDRKVPNGTFSSIAKAVEIEHNITSGVIKFATIRSRIHADNLDGTRHQWSSPIHCREEDICNMCESLAGIGQPLTRGQVISLATEMVTGTPVEQQIIEYKSKRKIKSKRLIGNEWYNGFMDRYSSRIKRAKVHNKDAKRVTWCKKKHFANMYDTVYERMVEAGVAVKLDKEVMLDENGVEVFDEKEMYGRKTRYLLTRPDQVIFVDETGCNTNMTEKSQIGGRKYVLSKRDNDVGKLGATTDNHFTVMCFTNGEGTPVLCSIILKSKRKKKNLHIKNHLGIDIRKNLVTGKNELEVLERNCQPGQAMAGGPVCTFNGKTIPCFVATSPKASITSHLLAKMLETMDYHKIFDRSNGKTPFLLLDGHFSRVQLPFLSYINEPCSRWTVCIGVPYGTHIWQVHDASSMNGTFKMNLNKAKMDYIEHRNGEFKFVMSDVVPLVSMVWKDSFGREDRAKRAIAARGWGPLNYILLDHPKLFDDEAKKTIGGATTAEDIGGASTTEDNESESNNVSESTTTSTVPFSFEDKPLISSYVDKLVSAKLKNDSENKKYEQGKIDNLLKKKVYKDVGEMTNYTSGSLAANNHYCYSVPELLANVKKRVDIKKQKNKEIKQKKNITDKQKDIAFMKSYDIYLKQPSTLRTVDLKVLLQRLQKKGVDSPIKTRCADIKEQFSRRHHKLASVPLPQLDYNDNDTTATAVARVEAEVHDTRNDSFDDDVFACFDDNDDNVARSNYKTDRSVESDRRQSGINSTGTVLLL